MELLQKLQETLLSFERKEFYKHVGFYFGIMLALVLALIYYYYARVSDLQKNLKKLNRTRQEVQVLLQKYRNVQKQKAEVNAMLAEEKNFKIKSFFDNLVHQHHLNSKLKKETEPSDEILHKKYTEYKLLAQFRQISTQQLCELLNSIEQKARVYTKELIITKTKGASLDVSLTIATLKPQSETKAR